MAESVASPAANPLFTHDTNLLLFRTLRFFRTLPNVFGLSRRYYGSRLPTHDPEEVTTLENLTLAHEDRESGDLSMPTRAVQDCGEDSNAFHPYPNKSSFLLGDWFWKGGLQKLQKSFKKLLRIIGDTEFRLEDIRATRWNLIDNELGSSAENADGSMP